MCPYFDISQKYNEIEPAFLFPLLVSKWWILRLKASFVLSARATDVLFDIGVGEF